MQNTLSPKIDNLTLAGENIKPVRQILERFHEVFQDFTT